MPLSAVLQCPEVFRLHFGNRLSSPRAQLEIRDLSNISSFSLLRYLHIFTVLLQPLPIFFPSPLWWSGVLGLVPPVGSVYPQDKRVAAPLSAAWASPLGPWLEAASSEQLSPGEEEKLPPLPTGSCLSQDKRSLLTAVVWAVLNLPCEISEPGLQGDLRGCYAQSEGTSRCTHSDRLTSPDRPEPECWPSTSAQAPDRVLCPQKTASSDFRFSWWYL